MGEADLEYHHKTGDRMTNIISIKQVLRDRGQSDAELHELDQRLEHAHRMLAPVREKRKFFAKKFQQRRERHK